MKHFKISIIIAIAFGAITTFSMPPWGFLPLLYIVFPTLVIAIEKTTNNIEAFSLGWAFGLGYFITSFSWIGEAFLVDAATFGIYMVPAIVSLASGFAIYLGLVTLLQYILSKRISKLIPNHKTFRTIYNILLFSSLWTASEWLRGVLFTGFPWNPIATVWVVVPEILSAASYFGIYGLTLLTIISCSSISVLKNQGSWGRSLAILSVCQIPLILIFSAGSWQLINTKTTTVPNVVLRLIQPNIAQEDKWKIELKNQNIFKQIKMSNEKSEHVTHFIWPEAAIPYALNQSIQLRQIIAEKMPENKILLTGAPRLENTGNTQKIFNSFFVLNGDGEILTHYDKTHLVPFGEYNPLESLFLVPGLTGSSFTPGTELKTIKLPLLPEFTPLICYEIIFSGQVTKKDSRPEWLLNITNDAWFGSSSGPYQHLAAARFRAAEEGVPIIRVANTGISAVIDPRGRILHQINIETEGFIDTGLPRAVTPTFFSKYKNMPLLTLMGIIFITTLTSIIYHRTKKIPD